MASLTDSIVWRPLPGGPRLGLRAGYERDIGGKRVADVVEEHGVRWKRQSDGPRRWYPTDALPTDAAGGW